MHNKAKQDETLVKCDGVLVKRMISKEATSDFNNRALPLQAEATLINFITSFEL